MRGSYESDMLNGRSCELPDRELAFIAFRLSRYLLNERIARRLHRAARLQTADESRNPRGKHVCRIDVTADEISSCVFSRFAAAVQLSHAREMSRANELFRAEHVDDSRVQSVNERFFRPHADLEAA